MSTAGTYYDETIKNGYAKLLMTQTASNSSAVDFTLPVTEFDSYEFDLSCIKIATDGALLIRCSNDGGASFPASADYWWAALDVWANAAPPAISHYGSAVLGSPQDTWLLMSHALWAGNNVSGRIRLVLSPGTVSQLRWCISGLHPSLYTYTNTGAGMRYVGGLNVVRFLSYTSTIGSGTIRMYGMRRG